MANRPSSSGRFDAPSDLAIDYALDAAAERLANPEGCPCNRCQDAEIEMRRELIEEGRRREATTQEVRATIRGRLE